ncbi:MAG: UDP-glucose/GDP-mannose dehydrogenase family protein [Deltaproteobacteria bacterium]|nr:UDP-glucose/GDP-mannose dehydrogenase family protein [Deltaproteobacteria bacterium]
MLVSSQLPVGTTRALAARHRAAFPDRAVSFACSPENLRLGAAIRCFREPDRVVVGVDDEAAHGPLAALFAPITERIEWMSVPSAEMTKHGLNAFLATSVVFANELAALCERVGADAREVTRGLTSDARIGPRAYLAPGAAFTGGTLARDVGYLRERARETGAREALWSAVLGCNDAHQRWALEHIEAALGDGLGGRRIAILGLAYKPGTAAVEHSAALDLALALARRGARVRAFDPTVTRLPEAAARAVELCGSLDAASADAEVIAILTPHPAFHDLDLDALASGESKPAIVDPAGVLAGRAIPARLHYFRVGAPASSARSS